LGDINRLCISQEGANYPNNTTYSSSKISFQSYYTLKYVSVVQVTHHQVEVEYTKINIKERDLSSQSNEL